VLLGFEMTVLFISAVDLWAWSIEQEEIMPVEKAAIVNS
jgi:hypothetical protein